MAYPFGRGGELALVSGSFVFGSFVSGNFTPAAFAAAFAAASAFMAASFAAREFFLSRCFKTWLTDVLDLSAFLAMALIE